MSDNIIHVPYFLSFRFTSVIRTGLEFAGTEKVTVGGGEAIWLYINKVLVIEFISDGNATDNCYYVDLSPAASAGKSKNLRSVFISSTYDAV